MTDSIEAARHTLRRVRRDLMRKPNVVATGIGYKYVNNQKTDQLAIICSVTTKQAKKNLSEKELVPALIDGLPLDVRPVGVIRALQNPTRRFRPAPGGVSIGHELVTAGTLGCWVRKDGKWYILSNNHVLANSNAARIGDAILQPGRYDGGEWPLDRIAALSDFVEIKFAKGESDCKIGRSAAAVVNAFSGKTNRITAVREEQPENVVDCALAEPLSTDDVLPEILNIGKVTGTGSAQLGTAVKKSGRTTDLTTGVIEQIDATVRVSYSATQEALFVDQLLAGAMSQGGDSGSAVLNEQNELVGLLFAGSDTITVINRIEHVFRELAIDGVE